MDRNYVSYLRARDPSILAYSQYRQNLVPLILPLMDDTGATQIDNPIQDDKFMKIFLRLHGNVPISPLYQVQDNVFNCEASGTQVSRRLRDGQVLHNTYQFSKIFDGKATQNDVFDTIVKPKIFELINGLSSTLLAYGASGSGKTFTIVGTHSNPGIIPRALEYLFRSLPALKNVPNIKVNENCSIAHLSLNEQKDAEYLKGFLLQNIEGMPDAQIHKETYKVMQTRLSNQPKATIEYDIPNVSLGIWISFAEIYNESVYDLLMPISKNRIKLNMCTGKNVRPHIKGLTSVSVSNGLEAYQILNYGLSNLRYAATALNDHSSRSHCIFTIKLVQSTGNDTNPKGFVSSFNFCDLAGSERLKKTNNVGDRLKESNNINTSLFVLGRCLKEVRDAQKRKVGKPIPYRESKLTQLFQHAIAGDENLSMIVNVNPSEHMYPETLHVLNFSAIAKQVKIETKPKAKVEVSHDTGADQQRIMELEEALFNMQEEIERVEEERQTDIGKVYKMLQEKVRDTNEYHRLRMEDVVKAHRKEIYQLRKELENSRRDSIVEIVDSDDEDNDDVHLRCKTEKADLRRQFQDELNQLRKQLDDETYRRLQVERQLERETNHLAAERRTSNKMLEKVIELEEEVEELEGYNSFHASFSIIDSTSSESTVENNGENNVENKIIIDSGDEEDTSKSLVILETMENTQHKDTAKCLVILETTENTEHTTDSRKSFEILENTENTVHKDTAKSIGILETMENTQHKDLITSYE